MRNVTVPAIAILTPLPGFQTIPDAQHTFVEGYHWRYSPALGVNALVPLGWVYQDLSQEPVPGLDIFITPQGVPPMDPNTRFSLFGGLRIRKMSIPPRFQGGPSIREFLEGKKKFVQKSFKAPPSYGERHRHYNSGAYECFEFENATYPRSDQYRTFLIFAFNDNVPSGYEITAIATGEDQKNQFESLRKTINLLQLKPD